jgi:hypothetical protein
MKRLKSIKSAPLGLNYRLITYNQGPAPYLLEHLRPAASGMVPGAV